MNERASVNVNDGIAHVNNAYVCHDKGKTPSNVFNAKMYVPCIMNQVYGKSVNMLQVNQSTARKPMSYAEAVKNRAAMPNFASSQNCHQMAHTENVRENLVGAHNDTLPLIQATMKTSMFGSKKPEGVFIWTLPDGTEKVHILDQLNRIPMLLQSKICMVMLDTGAGVNCIEHDYVKSLGLSYLVEMAYDRMLRDAQDNPITVFGSLMLPIQLDGEDLEVPCLIVRSLPSPVLLGTPFLVQIGGILDYRERKLRNGINSIIYKTVYLHTVNDVEIPPHSDIIIYCKPNFTTMNDASLQNMTASQNQANMLDITGSQNIHSDKGLIIKPSVAFRQDNGLYPICIMNASSKPKMIISGERVANAEFTHKSFLKPSNKLPSCVKLQKDHCLDRPTDYPCKDYNEKGEPIYVSVDISSTEASQREIPNSYSYRNDIVAGIRILWPEQPYCPPVLVDRVEAGKRTVACQAEVDIGNQTRIEKFQPIKWNEIIKLEPKMEEHRLDLIRILKRHRQAFAADLNEIAIMEGVYYRIDLKADATPVNVRTYRMPPESEKELDRQMEKLLSAGVIRPSEGSLWGAPAFIVYRRDNENQPIKPRLVLNFHETNKMIVRAKSPIPMANEVIDHIAAGKNKVFSVLDLASAFYAVQLTEDSKEICAINTRTQKYCFNRLPMGASNSPEVFSSLMSRCLGVLNNKHVMNYMDDILIMTETVEEHLDVLNKLLWRLRQVGLRISPTKVTLLQSSVKYLGYIFDKNGVRADPAKLQALVKLPSPKNVKQVREVMGALNFYKRFVKDYSKISLPINELLRQGEPFVWDQRRQAALDALKTALLKNAVLYSPDPEKPFIVWLDASDEAVGAVISQKGDDGLTRPCLFMSKTLNDCQKKYHSNDKEALALVESLKLCENMMGFRPQLEVYSDNLTNVYLHKLADRTGRLFRYHLYLTKFDIRVQHKQGKMNCVADLMSRIKYHGQPVLSDEEEPDKHSAISAAHCPYDELITGKRKPGRLKHSYIAPVTEDKNRTPKRRGFCMFDVFDEHNYPPESPTDTSMKNNVPTRHFRYNEDSDDENEYDELDKADYVPFTQDHHMSDEHDDNDDNERVIEPQDKETGQQKLDAFMENENPIYFEDVEGIQAQQVLNVYSNVLQNARILAAEQRADKDSADMYMYKLQKILPDPIKLAKRVVAEEDKYYLTDSGLLYRKFYPKPGDRMCHQLVLPAKHRFRISSLFHHGLHGSHRGFHSLLHLIRQRFYWKGLYDDLLKYVSTCHECQATKRDYSHIRTPLHLRDECRAFEVVHMDVLKISPTRDGDLKVLVMVDRFTKHFEIEKIENEKSTTLSQVFLTSWIQRFGAPRVVILDRAAAHMSEVFRTLAEQFNIKLNYIVGYRPQSNSAVERLHSKILTSLRSCIREYPQRPWTSFLSHVRWSNDMGIQTNGYSPYELMYGIMPSLSGDLDLEAPVLNDDEPQRVLESLWPDLAAMRGAAARNAREEAELMKRRYDARYKTKYKGFKPGDMVWLKEVKPRVSSQYKLSPRYKGPLTVVSSPLPGFHLLRLQNNVLRQLFPEERLKPYVTTDKSRLRTRVVRGNVGERYDMDVESMDENNNDNDNDNENEHVQTRIRTNGHDRRHKHMVRQQDNGAINNNAHKAPRTHAKHIDTRMQQDVSNRSTNLQFSRKDGKQQKGKDTAQASRTGEKHRMKKQNAEQQGKENRKSTERNKTVRNERKETRPADTRYDLRQRKQNVTYAEKQIKEEPESDREERRKESQKIRKKKRWKDFRISDSETESEKSDSNVSLPDLHSDSDENHELPDIQPVKHRKWNRKRKIPSKVDNTHNEDIVRKADPRDPGNQRKHQESQDSEKNLVDSFHGDGRNGTIDGGIRIKLSRKPHGQWSSRVPDDKEGANDIQSTSVMDTGSASTKDKTRAQLKHTTPTRLQGANQGQVSKLSKPKILDWSKLRKIVTSRQLTNGKTYLCNWKNRPPQWVKENRVPQEHIDAFNERMKFRKIMQQLNRAHGNMN